jgi:hypothetical protein
MTVSGLTGLRQRSLTTIKRRIEMTATTAKTAAIFDSTPNTLTLEQYRFTVGTLAPKGARVFYVIRRQAAGHLRMRLYVIRGSELFGIDQLVTPEVLEMLSESLRHWGTALSYRGFTSTDGSDSSGFGYEYDAAVNVPVHIIKGLAEIVTGDREGWAARAI